MMTRFLFILFLSAILPYLLARVLRFFLFRRFMKEPERADSGSELVQDPNCLTYLSKEAALKVEKEGAVDYFCGPDCAAAFEGKRVKKG